MMHASIARLLLLTCVVVSACAAPQPAERAGTAAGGSGQGSASAPRRTLVIGNDAAIEGFGEMFAGGKSGPEQLQALVHRVLAEVDDKSGYVPGVAAALPSTDNGTWTVFPDGRSETVWQLRPDVRWHDGTPLTSEDVIFSWQVAVDREVPYRSRTSAVQIEGIEARDARTFAITWKTVFSPGGRLTERDLFILPRHLLEATFLSDRSAFINLPYWTGEFVGTGPYRIVEWAPGSHVRVEAFDGFYGERPRIPTMIFRHIPDMNTAAANIRAGEVDVWLGSSVGIEMARDLRDTWEPTGAGRILTSPRLIFLVRLRADDPKVADPRIRRALYQAIDRETIVRDLYFGLLQVAHSYVAPGSTGFERIDARTTKHPYDPARVQQLLAELGWRKGPDGLLRNERGEEYALPFATTASVSEREQLQAVIANMWKAAGFAVTIDNVPASIQSDPSYAFPTTDLSGIGSDFEANITRIDGRNRRSPQNPRGANQWGYANDEVDALLDRWLATFDRDEQIEIEAAVIHRVSEDLPILPINYRIEAITVARGVEGIPTRGPKAGATNTWNAETWTRN
jgi:peptide/nickel transport system substrate-binding protein